MLVTLALTIGALAVLAGIAIHGRHSRSNPADSRSIASARDGEIAEEARALGRALDALFAAVGEALRPGMTTREIDDLVAARMAQGGLTPAFPGYHGYPARVTASINEEIINTIPSGRALLAGDLLKLQIGIRGTHAHAIGGWTWSIGEPDAARRRLLDAGLAALADAVAAVGPGARTGDIGAAVQTRIEEAGYSVCRQFVGYRTGPQPHMDPPIPGYGQAGRGVRLRRDWVLVLFVIALEGGAGIEVQSDGWNALSTDGRPSVMFSRMVRVGEAGAEPLTALRPVISS